MDPSDLDDIDHTSRVEEIEALTAIYPGDIEVKEDEMIPLANGEWKLHKQRGAIMTIYSNDEDRANSATLSVDGLFSFHNQNGGLSIIIIYCFPWLSRIPK